MHILAVMAKSVAMLVLGGGLIWAIARWRSQRREAVLVAVACALLLAVELLWLPGLNWVYRVMARGSYVGFQLFASFGSLIRWLATAAAFGFLIFAALGKKRA
jgi:hypothetical protein